MALPSSGPLSLNDIATEFGGSTPHSLSEYYAGGGLVPAGTSGTYGAVPSSGTISIQNFYGTSNITQVTFTSSTNWTVPAGVTLLQNVTAQGTNGTPRIVNSGYNFYGFVDANNSGVPDTDLGITTWGDFYNYVLGTAISFDSGSTADRSFVFSPRRYGWKTSTNTVWGASYISWSATITGTASIYWYLPTTGSASNMGSYTNFTGPGPSGAWFGVVADRVQDFGSYGYNASAYIPSYGTIISYGGDPTNPTSYPASVNNISVTPGSTVYITIDGPGAYVTITY